jgi:hypothetical protein
VSDVLGVLKAGVLKASKQTIFVRIFNQNERNEPKKQPRDREREKQNESSCLGRVIAGNRWSGMIEEGGKVRSTEYGQQDFFMIRHS